MSTEFAVEINIDATGQTCPGPILTAKKQADKLSGGQILRLVSDCPGTEADMTAWAERTGKEILQISEFESGAKEFYVRKGDQWQVDRNLDLRGQKCPDPIVLAGKELHQMQSGQTLKVTTDCRGAIDDIRTWSKTTGHQLLGVAPGPYGSDVSYISA